MASGDNARRDPKALTLIPVSYASRSGRLRPLDPHVWRAVNGDSQLGSLKLVHRSEDPDSLRQKSSLVTRRTKTFVSTARMAPLDVVAPSGLQVRQGVVFRCRGEDCPMNVFRCVQPDPPDNDLLPFLIPLQNRSRTDSEPSSNLRRHGDLPLCGELRLRDWHGFRLPR